MSTKRTVQVAVALATATSFLGALTATTAHAADRHPPAPPRTQPPTFVGERPAPASRDYPGGAPYSLHYGPTGLCAIGHGFDWSQVPAGDFVFFETSHVLAIKGSFDVDTLVEIEPDDRGTATAFDDELMVRVTSFYALDEVHEAVFPLYDTDGGGSIDAKATENTPQALYLKRIELYATQNEVATAVVNNSRVPMAASGWFAEIVTGHNGFYGGDGPDCIDGSLFNDVIRSGGGSDWVKSKDGADSLDGGAGDDTIQAGAGNDVLRGDFGIDRLEGGPNDDCHNGGQDELRDVLDDTGYYDFDSYQREEGVVDGEDVYNIEIVIEEAGTLVEDCV